MHSQVIERSLTESSWKFRKKNDEKWLKATVPGTIHTDLLTNKKIADPFYGNNEKQLQWIENEDWEYKTTFSISKIEMLQSHIELQFDGLDTYAKVFVNDSLVLIADNMFRSWTVDVKKFVHKGRNKLNVVFESAVKKGKEEAKKIAYVLPGDEKVFTRKAQYQYGWDWGPRFVTCGIWKNVKLVCWNDAKILNVKYVQKILSDSLAKLEFVCKIKSDIEANAYLDIAIGGEGVSDQMTLKIALKKGVNDYAIPYTIKNPQLWWCNGLGFPTMYSFKIHLSYDSRFLDEKIINIGLRTIELIQDKDSIGKSFYFKLNGAPVFMKGANYIPPDNFLPRVKNENYETIVENALYSNMNMLRVWGGGVYADDAFYEACDKNGILVWQDFMFACAMYPGDDHFINNVAQEVVDQLERLRNHPCIALWCGNNEVDEGWKNWGWQKQYNYSKEDSTLIAQNNFVLFDNFIKGVVNIYDDSRAYWPSSPSIGWGHKESLQEGDSHYWGVWWGMEAFENYEKKVGRFVSEYGFQGMPSLKTMYQLGAFGKKIEGRMIYEDEYRSDYYSHILDSVNIKSHQKHPTGYKTINAYMERDYKIPYKFEDYIYVSQLLQAKGMKIAIEAHRRAKPNCMGTLYWQLNDCWPVTSWSSVDYNNDWKASQYEVKRLYENMILSIDENDTVCNVYVISDEIKKKGGWVHLQLFDFTGKKLWSDSLTVGVSNEFSEKVYTFNKKVLNSLDKSSVALKASYSTFYGKKNIAYTLHYFVKPKELKLLNPDVMFSQGEGLFSPVFTIKSNVLMKDVFLSIEGESINLSDNYFDLLPNETKTIYLPYSPKSFNIKNLDKKIKIKSLIDTY